MKKALSVLISFCMVICTLPYSVYAVSSTPEVSLDEFTSQFKELQAEYDGELIGDIVFENDSEFFHLNGELMPLTDDFGNELSVNIDEKNPEMPKQILDELSVEVESEESPSKSSAKRAAKSVADEEYAESIGYELEINDDTAVLTQPYQTHRLIVKSKYDINPLNSIAIVEGYNDLHIVQFDDLESTKKAEAFYESQRNIEYVEPDSVVSTLEYEDAKPNANSDLNRGIVYANHLSWGSESIGVDDYTDYITDVSTLPQIVVAVIDTGIELNHKFLKDRIIRTGFNSSYSGDPNSENDDHGHGTHVSGIVVDNTTENVKIKGYKVLNNEGDGTIENVCLGMEQAISDGVNIINMSLGMRGKSPSLEYEVSKAVDNRITVCVSAGNSGVSAEKFTPAGIPNCITVSAIDENDKLPFFSNWGDAVDIVAPGVSINSSFLGNTYKSLSGTSMASPFAAAASALILSLNPHYDSVDINEFLVNNGRVWYKESDAQFVDSLYGVPAVYIGNISSYGQARTARPRFSIAGGRYSDSVLLELTCEDSNAEIYYTLDGTRADNESGILYTEPILIDKITRVHAVAYSAEKLKSLQAMTNYYIMTLDPEGNFEIASNGIITAYNGDNSYLIIPDKINGIPVTGIGNRVFTDSSIKNELTMIRLPKTATYIGDFCFHGCSSLWDVQGGPVKEVGRFAFSCPNLELIDFSEMETVGPYAFSQNEGITEIKNDKIEIVNKCSFYGMCNLVYVDMPNVVSVDYWGFNNLVRLEKINLPNVRYMGKEALSYSPSILELEFPMLETLSIADGGQFKGLSKLEEISLSSFVGTIPREAFAKTRSLKRININGATSIGEKAFYESAVETAMLPNVETIDKNAFSYCENLKTLFLPSLKTCYNLPFTNGTKIYLSEKFESGLLESDYSTIIAPKGSAAHNLAISGGHTFIDSSSLVGRLGRSIRITDAGLRFGFNWENIAELEELASEFEYGFVYEYANTNDLTLENGRIKRADKFLTNDEKTGFNLVFTNIPKANFETQISARAYVYIDGMVFYSPILHGSFREVATLVLDDPSVNSSLKNQLRNLLEV